MQILNSLSGEKEILTMPAKGNPLHLFVCGPTVYDYSHIGHARTYIAFDAFVRYLRSQGHEVFYLQNITNIDDKIIDRAREEKKDPLELAKYFEEEYRKDMESLGVTSVTQYAPATDYIEEIVGQVERLIEKGYAYKIDDDGYYFDISKFKDYGKLSGRTATQAEDAISRIDEGVKKRNKGDFALWKLKSHDYEPSWSTRLGEGRPGWHIEDTAISEHFFGPQYDIHGGGIDLKFPHHEAEIAQQEAASGKIPFVRIWMHTGFLLIQGEKMSKSLKNFITIRDLLTACTANAFRLIVLQHHYRTPLNYTDELIAQGTATLFSAQDFFEKLQFIEISGKTTHETDATKSLLKETEQAFHESLQDDFNTPRAIAAIFLAFHALQKDLWALSKGDAKLASHSLRSLLETLGLTFQTKSASKEAEALLHEREIFRGSKQFIQADELRNKIKALGYEIEDTPLGPWLKPI